MPLVASTHFCSANLLCAFAEVAGLPTDGWVPLSGGRTNAVWAQPSTHTVLRVAGADICADESQRTLTLADQLARRGVAVVAPTKSRVLRLGARHATRWKLETAYGPVDYEAFGAATRTLHVRGADVARNAQRTGLRIPAALDHEHLRRALDLLRVSATLSAAEYALLEPWVDRLAEDADRLGCSAFTDSKTSADDERGRLVHDDLWAKNAIPVRAADGTAKVVLADCDNLAWGPAEYDLAFITRGVEAGKVTAGEASAFASGYGEALPNVETAWAFARAHRLRWVLLLVERRVWLPYAHEALVAELPLWACPRGPQAPR